MISRFIADSAFFPKKAYPIYEMGLTAELIKK